MALALPPQFEEAVEGRLQDLGKELTCPVWCAGRCIMSRWLLKKKTTC